MLRKIRFYAAILCFGWITLLFLDFTGKVQHWFGWLAKIQLLPALLALNGVIVVAVLLVTLLFGRIYCSVLCPLGVFQDVVAWFAGLRRPRRFRYTPPRNGLRLGSLAVFAVLVLLGLGPVFALVAPYSAYGRMVSSLLGPIYGLGNNLIAKLAAGFDSFLFYEIRIGIPPVGTLLGSLATFALLAVLAWRNGRTYCNTICPVGTLLGTVSRFALFRPRIETSQCSGCGVCARSCKAGCIDPKGRTVDPSRCVSCLTCIDNCPKGLLHFTWRASHD
jgi:polyferredoxin